MPKSLHGGKPFRSEVFSKKKPAFTLRDYIHCNLCCFFLFALSFELCMLLEPKPAVALLGLGVDVFLDGYNMFAIDFVIMSTLTAEDSWQICHLGCCLDSW
ncbi:unnamed protein product [Ilex paraguariensis]|uniref:Uncharacterized protein n=1 Tax=Ilex paraguariensis TaxID=185542 RepID=A0ABC8RIL5_9AQUA